MKRPDMHMCGHMITGAFDFQVLWSLAKKRKQQKEQKTKLKKNLLYFKNTLFDLKIANITEALVGMWL